jgi:hypothetical protein
MLMHSYKYKHICLCVQKSIHIYRPDIYRHNSTFFFSQPMFFLFILLKFSYIYTYTHIYTYTDIQSYMHVLLYAHTYVYIHVYMYLFLFSTYVLPPYCALQLQMFVFQGHRLDLEAVFVCIYLCIYIYVYVYI